MLVLGPNSQVWWSPPHPTGVEKISFLGLAKEVFLPKTILLGLPSTMTKTRSWSYA